MTTVPGSSALTEAPESRRREQRAWYFYDWANSGYVTTVGTVLFAPYLTSVAERAACGVLPAGGRCARDLSVLGIAVSPGSLVFYVVTVSTVLSALVLPVVGALADRSGRLRRLLAGLAWAGSAFAAAMFLVTGSNWQLGAVVLVGANLCLGSSLVVYDAILCAIALPEERDRVSSRGWALGYLGGGLLLAANLALVTLHDRVGLSQGTAVRICLLSAAVWWAAFTLIPYRGLRDRLPVARRAASSGGLLRSSFGQLARTLRELRRYPMTLLFLVAYLFYNDGIQTVIVASSTYGEKELGFDTGVLIATILVVQFVGIAGALLFGAAAARVGAKTAVLAGLVLWTGIVAAAYLLPERRLVPFVALGALIGLVLGGTQALSRSLFSQLVPHGREAEYFALYQACERGTSWLGTLVFGLVHQLTDSYRPAIVALVAFFLLGAAALARVDVQRGAAEAAARPMPV